MSFNITCNLNLLVVKYYCNLPVFKGVVIMSKFKKSLSLILAVIVLISALPTFAFNITASALTDGYFTYTVENGEVIITDCNTSISGDIEIPSTLGGYPVTKIGDDAFYYCTSLTSVIIPDGVTKIGARAFYQCTSLAEITIPNSVVSINEWAFGYCAITTITIPKGITTINESTFDSCKSLVDIEIPNSVTSIGFSAFYNCDSLKYIKLPENLTLLGECSFYGCNSLTNITIPRGVTSIGRSAFLYCDSLASISLPDSVISIGDAAFRCCTSLTNITISNSVKQIGLSAFSECENLQNIYYCGTEEEWNNISIGSNNDYLLESTRYYHDYGDWQIRTEPTCTENGEKYRVCSVCGEEEVELITTNSHRAYNVKILNDNKYPFELNGDVYSSTNKTHNSSSVFTITAFKDTTLEIEYKTSSESGYDKLRILKNSEEEVNDSGVKTDWKSVTLDLSAGDIVFIKYTKDGSVNNGDDTVCFKLVSGIEIVSTDELEPNCANSINCVDCGNVIKPANNQHWYYNNCDEYCDLCNAYRVVTHSTSSDCDEYCDLCNAYLSPNYSHTYTDECDEYCNYCDEWRDAPHDRSSVCDEYCNECYSYIGSYYSHTYDGCYDNDCDYCGEWRDTPAHTYDDCYSNWCYDCGEWLDTPHHTYSDCYDNDCNYCLEWRDTPSHTYDGCYDSYCDYCGAWRDTPSHIYDDDWDEYCNSCDEYRPVYVGCGHYYESDCDEYCNYCGEWRTPEILGAEHYYDGCEDEYCDYCGEWREAREHIYDNCIDENCNECYHTREVVGHIYDDDWDEYCNRCNEYRPAFVGCDHRYDNDCDPECNYCEEIREIEHTYSNYYDLECNICGYIRYLSYSIYYGEVTITDCDTSISGYIEIPSYIEGYPVRIIDNGAFENCNSFTRITIPDSVTSIGDYAFYSCDALETVTIGNGVVNIGNNAFFVCYNLLTVMFGNSVESIGAKAFDMCSKLSNLVLPESLTSIGESAFNSCKNLTSITIPSNVRYIGTYAFGNCSSLANITFCDGVTNIGNGAFHDCAVTEIIIPDSITSIDDYAFGCCYNLTSVHIPNTVTSIGAEAFMYCNKLTSIVIPKSVTSIGNKAFYECTSFSDVYYCGTEEEWNNISIGSNNDYLLEATRYHHNFSDWQIRTEPTCTENGEKYRTCSICGEEETEVIFPLEHNYLTILIVDPTCIANGYTIYACDRCGDIYNDNFISATGHDFGDWQVRTESTCTKNGEKYRTCSICGEEETEATLPLAHNMNTVYVCRWEYPEGLLPSDDYPPESENHVTYEKCYCINCDFVEYENMVTNSRWYSVVTEPTCTEHGILAEYCSYCDSLTNEIYQPQLEHNYLPILIVDPTCIVNGYTIYACDRCGDIYNDDFISATGHDFSDWQVRTEPTCTENGEKYRTCSICGEEETEVMDIVWHNFQNGICSYCDGYLESEHNYQTEYDETWIITKDNTASVTITFSEDTFVEEKYDFIYIYDANDNEIGKYNGGELAGKSVTVSGNIVKIRLVTDRIYNYYGFKITNIEFVCDHNYKVETKPVSCTEDGYTKHTCKYCGDVYYTDQVKAIGHNYIATVIEPICVSGGYTENICENCGDSYTENHTNPTNVHIYENGNCVQCNAYIESEHNYQIEYAETWVIKREGASSITITFSNDTFVEEKYDFIYIYDANDNEIGKYDGDKLAGKSITINGDTVKIRLVSDRINTAYGFKVTDISAVYKGDLNGDGEVNILDFIALHKAIAESEEHKGASADINGNGNIGADDLILLKKFLLVIITDLKTFVS